MVKVVTEGIRISGAAADGQLNGLLSDLEFQMWKMPVGRGKLAPQRGWDSLGGQAEVEERLGSEKHQH